METNSLIINNDEDKKKIFDNLNNVFSKLNSVFDNLNNVFDKDLFNYTKKKDSKKRVFNLDDLDDDFEITDEEILVKLLSINKNLIQKKENLRVKIYRKIFYLKKFSILDDSQEYIKYIELFQDDDEDEYKEFKKAMELFEDEDKYNEFKKLVDKYYSINKLTQAIKFYFNIIKN